MSTKPRAAPLFVDGQIAAIAKVRGLTVVTTNDKDFGGFKGLLAASVIFLLGTMVFDVLDPGRPRPDWLAPRRTAPLIETTSKAMVDFVAERRARAAKVRGEPAAS